MTRAEYEAKYGSKPPVDTFDTTPAPIRMTKAEYDAKYRSTTPKVGYFGDMKRDFLDIGTQAVNEFQTRGQNIVDTATNPDLTPAQKTTSQLGQGFLGIGNFVGNSILGLARTFTPQSVEDKVTETVANTVEEAKKYTQDFKQKLAASPDATDQEINSTIDSYLQQYETNPQFKSQVDAAGGFATGLADLVGARGATQLGTEVIEQGAKIDITPVTSRLVRSADDKAAKALETLENKYSNTRNANTYEKDAGAASRQRITSSNVLAGAVDEDGVIRTLTPGGAVDQYRKITIEGVEDVVRKNLEREGKTVTLPEIKRALTLAVNESGLEGADLTTALRGIEREIQGLAMRSDNLNSVPLFKVQDAKISTTKNINFNTPPEKATYRKSIARAYKELIERKSNFNVKEVNSELAQYYKDIERLERLDGKRVQGGRLGKYVAQLTGNVVGGAAGSVAGGPGAAFGSLLGGEAAALLKGKSMARTFGSGEIKPTTNPVLEAARKNANLPPGRALDVPDEAIGVPKGIAKTKDMTKVEAQIKQNIKQQKDAIKAKDYDLVATLKKVYDALVAQLNELIEFAKENINDQGGFIKNPFVRSEIDKVKPSNPRGRNLNAEAKAVLEKGTGDGAALEVIRTYLANKGGSGITRTELATAIDMAKGKVKRN